jgi:hypothetical protein
MWKVPTERRLDLFGLSLTEQAVVDEDARELIADRLVDQRRRHRRVDPARQPADDLLITDLRSDRRHLLFDDGVARPGGPGITTVEEEPFQDLHPARRVGHLGVELHSEDAPLPVLHRRHRRRRGGGDTHESFRDHRDRVTMAHPHVLALGQVTEQHRARRHLERGLAELPGAGVGNGATQLHRHQLVAVTDAQHRDAELEDARIHPVGVLGVHRSRATGEDDAHRRLGADLVGGDVAGDDLGVDPRLADPPGDQLGVLGPEVEDQHGVERGCHPMPTRCERCRPLPSVWSDGAIMTSAFWNSLTSE